MNSLSDSQSETNKNKKTKPSTKFNPTDNAESIIDCNNDNQYNILCDKEYDPTLSMNNSAIFENPDQNFWSYENPGFYSLPARGNKRFRRPGIKFMINSETVSQTRTLVYKDYQKNQNLSFSNSSEPTKLSISQSSSSSSLNSNNDPDTAAALDQIASEMGLIEHPVMKQSSDPVKYLLAKRSFSERISSTKNNFVSNNSALRSFSHMDQNKQPISTASLKENVSLPNSSPVQSSHKKQSRISRIIEKFSPNLSRRSRSISSVLSKVPHSEPRNVKLGNYNNVGNSIKKEINSKTIDKELPSESNSILEPSSNKVQLAYFNETSKKILNSLKVDRIDHLQNKFRNISKRRTEVNGVCQTVDIIPKRDMKTFHTPEPDYSKNNHSNRNLHDPNQKQSITNARYVNVSLCAFGYGPHQRSYQSPFESSSTNTSEDNQFSKCISNDSNNQICENKLKSEHII